MRPPARIQPWLDINQMFSWLQDAPDPAAYQRRLAIWLTHTGRLHARKVARILGVSPQAVWLWVGQYNRHGPLGLERTGRGGRRWGLLSPRVERQLVIRVAGLERRGERARELRRLLEDRLSRRVSLAYVYRLLQRHRAALETARQLGVQAPSASEASFRRHAQPWLRQP